MAAPNVSLREKDYSQRVEAFRGVYCGQVVISKKGEVGVPHLMTSQTQFLSEYTPNDTLTVFDDLTCYDAITTLRGSNRVWIVRAAPSDCKYAGLMLQKAGSEEKPVAFGSLPESGNVREDTELDPTSFDFSDALDIYSDAPNFASMLFASSQGKHGNDIYITVTNVKDKDTINIFHHVPEIKVEDSNIIEAIAGDPNAEPPTVDVPSSIYKDNAFTDVTLGQEIVVFPVNTSDETAGLTAGITYYVYKASGNNDSISLCTSLANALNKNGDDDAPITVDLEKGANNNFCIMPASYVDEAVFIPVANISLAKYPADAAANNTVEFTVTTAPETGTPIILHHLDSTAVGPKDISVADTLPKCYYVIKKTQTTFWIADTYEKAITESLDIIGIPVTVSSPTVGATGLWMVYPNINPVDDTITTQQDWYTGESVVVKAITPGKVIPLISSRVYYVVRVAEKKIKLSTSLVGAVQYPQVTVDLTTIGATGFYMYPTKDIKKAAGGQNNVFEVAVYKKSNLNVPVEIHICSFQRTLRDGYGNSLFMEEVLKRSKYLLGKVNPAYAAIAEINAESGITTLPNSITVPTGLTGGFDGTVVDANDMILALRSLSNKNDTPVTLLLDGGFPDVSYKQEIYTMCKERGDCFGILTVPSENELSADFLNEIVGFRKNDLNANTSWGAIFSPNVWDTDYFNNRKVLLPISGYVANKICETADNFELWVPAAGTRRGILNVLDVARRFSPGEMDYLYDNQINPIRYVPGRGIMIWGWRTLQSYASALEGINVRLMLIEIEPAISTALESFLFELNDEATRAMVRLTIDSYMKGIQARRGVYDYKVVCDGNNNTAEDIDNHILNVWLFVKPTIDVEFIRFDVVITRTGMSFDLVEQQL